MLNRHEQRTLLDIWASALLPRAADKGVSAEIYCQTCDFWRLTGLTCGLQKVVFLRFHKSMKSGLLLSEDGHLLSKQASQDISRM